MSVTTFSWIYLVFFTILMLWLGYVGMRKTHTGEDYAVARGSYPWWVMALAYVATTASGSTFMGIPGMAYSMGFKALYYPMIYPIGIYFGSMMLARRTKKMGDRLGSMSIPDYLGDYYQSNLIRVLAALISVFLIYYIMAQLVAAGQMFAVMLGLNYQIAIWVAGLLVVLYMTMGGSHSDILTDAVQGLFMLFIALLVIVFFFTGFGLGGGGAAAVNAKLPEAMQWNVHTDPKNATFYAWWTIVLLFIAHIPFTTLPHLGNKFFALRGTGSTKTFNLATNVLGLTMGAMVFAGLLGKAYGLELKAADQVVPQLLVALTPPWIAAFLSIAILSAIVSTTDGLFMSVSQIFANDLYRKTWVPLTGGDINSPEVNRRALMIGRIGIIIVGIAAILMVRKPPALLSILLWVGIGGIVSAFAGPMFLAAFWSRANRVGALWGMIVSFAFYFWIHLGPQFKLYAGIFPWNKNPFASAGVGAIISLVVTVLVSLATQPMPKEHIQKLWAPPSSDETIGNRTAASHGTISV
ncbi:Na+/proline symporter [Clostridiales bacterium PH28_bin88]|nr:Na+/proline symporter [Clostridiales bacterium PH28_bin88]